MPTLSVVKSDFIKIAKWGGIIIATIIILFIVFRVFMAVKEMIFPSPPPAPTVSFGKLPAAIFPEGIKKNFSYEIDTTTGQLPLFSDKETVYKMEEIKPDILAVERASGKVASLGFDPKPKQISDFLFRWTNPEPPNQNLILNVKLAEFNVSSDFLKFESDLNGKNFSDKSEAIAGASQFLRQLGLYPEDIDEEKTVVDFSFLNNGVIQPTTRAVISNLATVYFFQKSKNEIPIVYPQGTKSSMRLVVGAGEFLGDVVDGGFFYQKILDESATYPIKTAEEAFEELKNGKGHIASHRGGDLNILIKKVYIGLYAEGRIQKYITPVIVFEGNNEFLGFVSAIKDEWIDK